MWSKRKNPQKFNGFLGFRMKFKGKLRIRANLLNSRVFQVLKVLMAAGTLELIDVCDIIGKIYSNIFEVNFSGIWEWVATPNPHPPPTPKICFHN